MICFIYEENQSLPRNRADILKTLYKLLGDRSAVKVSGNICDEHDNMLSKLGKLAWEALKANELILNKVIGIFNRNISNRERRVFSAYRMHLLFSVEVDG